MSHDRRIPPTPYGGLEDDSTVLQTSNASGVNLVPGTMVGEYEIVGELGEGGMGAVFAAVHPRIGKKAAIKVLHHSASRDSNAILRFENEARAVNEIHHPNIVDIFAFGELPNGCPYFVMDRVAGETLDAYLDRRGRISLADAMPILRQVFDALSAAHARAIIHRDLKPGNIMIEGDGASPRVKILDFGLAKIMRGPSPVHVTNPGTSMGTPLFMSPEQYLGESVDHRTDIYALGVMVYRMVCGVYPFVAENSAALGIMHMFNTPVAPSSREATLPAALDRVILRALAKEADDRFQSVREFLGALEACSTARTVTSMPALRPSDRIEPQPAKRGWLFPLVLVALVGGGTAAIIAARSGREDATMQPATTQLPSPAATTAPATTPPTPPATTTTTEAATTTAPPTTTAAPTATTPTTATSTTATSTTATSTTATSITAPTSTKSKGGAGTRKSQRQKGSKAGSGSTKPCDPYRSLDGC